VSFLVPTLRREYGGCAGNIAYTLAALGATPVVLAAVGADGAEYVARLAGLGCDMRHVLALPETYTAQCIIITDQDNNQITAFHPGAMNHAHENRVEGALGAGLAIIAPDGKEGMIQHARQCAGAGIPFVFDPGQGLPMFSGEELAEFVRLADYVAVNDYEGKLLEEKTGRKLEELAGEVKALIVTRGARGSRIFAGGRVQDIPIAPAESVTDPTGCGDAYRAGLLYGIAKGWDWANTGRLGAVLGAIKIASRGAQNHRADRALVEARFQQAFGYSPWS